MQSHVHDSWVRWGPLALFAVFLVIAAQTFYKNGSSPTDENLFTNPPSRVMVGPVVPVKEGAATPDLQPGDFLLGIDGTSVGAVADVTSRLARSTGRLSLKVRRPAQFVTITTQADAAALAAVPLIDASNTVLVIAVTPGGGSDRAGMLRGDVITRINGQHFEDALGADAIMRRGQAGRATAYDVMRAARSMTLHVTLARFGFTLGVAVVFLCGIVWMTFGAFLAAARPAVHAARLLGFGLLTFGFGLAVMFIRPFTQATPLTLARDLLMGASFLVGIALLGVGNLYCPRPSTHLETRRWAVPLVHWTTALAGLTAGAVAVVAPGRYATLALLLAALLVLLAVRVATWGCRRARPADEQRILRPLVWTGRGAGLLTVTYGVLMASGVVDGNPAVFGVTLLAIPIAYAWTIGRHRLFDLDLRVRRTIQYSVASLGWAGLSIAALLWLLVTLPAADLGLPNVRLRAGAVELLETPASPEDKRWAERFVLMVGAIGLAFLFRRIGRDGQQWLATRFHRTEYDYKRASQDLAVLMASRLDLDGLADGLVATLVRLMPVERAGVIFVHGPRTYCGRNAFGFQADAWESCCVASCDDVVRAVGSAQDQVSADYVAPRLRDVLARASVRYLYPIRHRDALAGVLLVGDKKSEAAFKNADFEFLDGIARQVAPSVENAFLYEDLAEQERLRHELEIARRIQLESLPQFTPDVAGLDIAAASIPALEVGGDYYDYLGGPDGRFTVIVGDVSGKGTSAALYMSKLQGILRTLHGFDLTLRDLFVRANALLCREMERGSFVTALGATFDVPERRVTVSRAGHLPLYHFDRASATVRRLLPRGLGLGLSSLGVFADELETVVVAFAPGDVFLLITDGILESQSAKGGEFGEERVATWFAEAAGSGVTAGEVRDALLDATRRFAGDVEQFDDQTVVVVRAT